MLSSKVRFPLLVWVVGLLTMAAVPGWSFDTYYWCGGEQVPLVPSDQYVAVKVTAATRSPLPAGPRLRANYDTVGSSYYRQLGVMVMPSTTRSVDSVRLLAAQAAADPQTEAVLRAYGAGRAVSVDIGEFMVQFRTPPSAAALAALQQTYGFHIVEDYTDWLSGGYRCAVNNLQAQSGVSVANDLHDHEEVYFAEPNLLRTIEVYGQQRAAGRSRMVPTDPLFARQWHLQNTGPGQFPASGIVGELLNVAGADVKAVQAWDTTTGSPNITVAVIDQGTDVSHPEFQPRATKIKAMRDVLDGDNDPSPEFANEGHGTACSGLAVANQDGAGVTGVAPGCRLMPIRFLDPSPLGRTTDSMIVAAFRFAQQRGADVISCSWGLHGIPLPTTIKKAIDNAVQYGRGGKGCVVAFSAGNSGDPLMSDPILDPYYTIDQNPYASYDKVIGVGATNWRDTKSFFSEIGNALDITAPGGEIRIPAVAPPLAPCSDNEGCLTADVSGAMGYQSGNYTDATNFSGTSASCPIVAGVAALVLSVNPDLTPPQVQDVLQSTADKIDPLMAGYDSAGHSLRYGYGRINAAAAVAKAGAGTRVTFTVNTLNGPTVGGRLTDQTSAIPVTYTQLGYARTAEAWDDAPVTIACDPGTDVILGVTDKVGSAVQRWQAVPGQQNQFTVAATPLSLSMDYYNQLNASLATQVPTDATPLTAGNNAAVTYTVLGQPGVVNVATAEVRMWADAGTQVTYPARSSGTTADQRWLLLGSQPLSYTLTMNERTFSPTYYHQLRPTVTLSGATRSNPVTVTNHTLFGSSVLATPAETAYGTWSDWADVGSQIGFSERSTGSPILVAMGTRAFKVAAGLNATVPYEILAVAGGSTLAASATELPADGTTQVVLTVTVRDSAGQALAGISPERLTLGTDTTEGLAIVSPTTATDANGQATFRVTRSVDGPVVFRANVDGEAVQNSVTVSFLRVMDIPLPVPGLYLTTFPIVVPNSAEQIAAFSVAPKPTRLAGWNEDLGAYQAFDPAAPSTFFDIVPGKGWFLQTTVPGSIRLYGTWSTTAQVQPSYPFDVARAAYHLIGNPRPDQPLAFRMQDVRIFVNGVDQGDLRTQANWGIVDPFLWAFNGRTYELIMDPNMPGAAGVRSQLEVFEGAFWRTRVPNVRIVIAPGSVARAAAPVGPGNFGFSVLATAGEETSRVVVGAQTTALRSVRPPTPEGAPNGVLLEVLASDGSRGAADFVGGALVSEATWRLRVSGTAGRQVSLSWPSLMRQLPAGYRARLTDPTSGRVVSLNTTGSYLVNTDRELILSVAPRSAGALAVQNFQPTTTRGGSVEFDVTLTAPAELVVQVTSLSGRVVAQTAPVQGNGATRIVWNGLDTNGRPLPAGVYNVTLVAHDDQGDTVRAVRTVRLR